MIRLAKTEDLERILEIYEIARAYMQGSGNPNQWGSTYPPGELLEEDLAKQQLFVCTENHIIHGVFAFIIGEDSTYRYIEGGTWLNDGRYGTIHRLAGDGKKRGIFAECLKFCKSQIGNLRADTHHDNLTMQHLLEKNGFEKCGVIYLADGSPRIAYQWC